MLILNDESHLIVVTSISYHIFSPKQSQSVIYRKEISNLSQWKPSRKNLSKPNEHTFVA